MELLFLFMTVSIHSFCFHASPIATTTPKSYNIIQNLREIPQTNFSDVGCHQQVCQKVGG
jgi:hypothetical protein